MTVSNAAERSRRIRTDDSLVDLAVCKDLIMDKRAVSVECAVSKPDSLGFLLKDRKGENREGAFRDLKKKQKKILVCSCLSRFFQNVIHPCFLVVGT